MFDPSYRLKIPVHSARLLRNGVEMVASFITANPNKADAQGIWYDATLKNRKALQLVIDRLGAEFEYYAYTPSNMFNVQAARISRDNEGGPNVSVMKCDATFKDRNLFLNSLVQSGQQWEEYTGQRPFVVMNMAVDAAACATLKSILRSDVTGMNMLVASFQNPANASLQKSYDIVTAECRAQHIPVIEWHFSR